MRAARDRERPRQLRHDRCGHGPRSRSSRSWHHRQRGSRGCLSDDRRSRGSHEHAGGQDQLAVQRGRPRWRSAQAEPEVLGTPRLDDASQHCVGRFGQQGPDRHAVVARELPSAVLDHRSRPEYRSSVLRDRSGWGLMTTHSSKGGSDAPNAAHHPGSSAVHGPRPDRRQPFGSPRGFRQRCDCGLVPQPQHPGPPLRHPDQRPARLREERGSLQREKTARRRRRLPDQGPERRPLGCRMARARRRPRTLHLDPEQVRPSRHRRLDPLGNESPDLLDHPEGGQPVRHRGGRPEHRFRPDPEEVRQQADHRCRGPRDPSPEGHPRQEGLGHPGSELDRQVDLRTLVVSPPQDGWLDANLQVLHVLRAGQPVRRRA